MFLRANLFYVTQSYLSACTRQIQSSVVSICNIWLLISILFIGISSVEASTSKKSKQATTVQTRQKAQRKPAQAVTQAQAGDEFNLDDVPTTTVPAITKPPPAPVNSKSKAGNKSAKDPSKTSLHAQALDYFQHKNYDACIKLLWKSIDTLDRDEMILLSKAHIKKKEYPEVIRVTQMIISKDERDAEAHTLMGDAHYLSNREKEALASYKRATEINGIYLPAYDGLISIYEKRDNLYELRILYQDMIEKLGEKPEFLTKICGINTKDALNDHAIEYCRKAIQKSEDIPDNHVNLGLVYKNQGDLAKAQEKLKTAAERFKNSLYAQITYAQFSEEKSDFIESYRFYSNCLKLSPESEACLVGKGLAAVQIQKFDESLLTLKKACFKDRKNAVGVRKAVQLLRASKKLDWAQKFESLSEKCMLQ